MIHRILARSSALLRSPAGSRRNEPVNPVPGTPEHRTRRRSAVLGFVQLTLLALFGGTILFFLAAGYGDAELRRWYLYLLAGLTALLLVSYLINRLGRFSLAAGLLTACAVIGPWASVLISVSQGVNDYIPLIFTSIPIFMSAMLLPFSATVAVTALQAAGIAALLIAVPGFREVNWQSLAAFIVFCCTLGLVSSRVIRRSIRQAENLARELAESQAKLLELSVRDELTGLFNRRYMTETLDREIYRSARNGTEIAVMLMDLDGFKRVNDQFGHTAGDKVLIAVAQHIRSRIRAEDVPARWGGDEFVLILPGSGLQAAKERAEAILDELGKMSFAVGGQELHFTASFGISAYPRHGTDSSMLLEVADNALYTAKHREGKACACLAQ